MDGILVQDSDWNAKLSASLAELLEKKVLCDLGIVCGVQNDVSNLKTNEVVMVHRCILAGASETIRKLSIGGQVYNLVKINGIEISPQCWNNVLEFVYKGKSEVLGKNLCDVRKASQVLQIKSLEKAVDTHHASYTPCSCGKKREFVNQLNEQPSELDSVVYLVVDISWLTTLFEGMLDLLVKQSLCNMTIITEKQERVSAEILAHLCMLVASSSTIKELVLQGTETYNSVKIDSITYNTWLYLLEYIYTSRVSIVKSNIPEVWIASQLLQIDGLANAVAPFASQMGATLPDIQSHSVDKQNSEFTNEGTNSFEQSAENSHSDLIEQKKNVTLSNIDGENCENLPVMSTLSTPSDLPSVKTHRNIDDELCNESDIAPATPNFSITNISSSVSEPEQNDSSKTSSLSENSSVPSSVESGSVLVNPVLQDGLQPTAAQLSSSLVNVNIGLPGEAMTVAGLTQQVGQQILVPATSLVGGGLSPGIQTVTAVPAAPGLAGAGQLVNTIQPDGSTAMLWVPSQILPVVNANQIQAPVAQIVKSDPETAILTSPKIDAVSTSVTSTSPTKLSSIENKETTSDGSPDNSCLFFCNKCAHVFSQKSFLDKHTCLNNDGGTTGSPTSPTQSGDMNKLMCKFCKKVFSRTWTLNVHLRTHTGERPYKCKFCNKAFSDKSNMRQHSLIHTSRKEYNCPKCNQAFAQKRYMKKHYMETCRRKFTTVPDTVAHKLQQRRQQASQQQQQQQAAINTNFIISYQLDPVNNKTANNDISIKQDIDSQGVADASSSEHSEINLKCDIDMGKETLSKSDSADTSNSGSAWDTSIIMSHPHTVEGDDNDGEHGTEVDGGSESELTRISLGDHSNHSDEMEEDVKLFCKDCKRHFKTERQRNSHRCMDF